VTEHSDQEQRSRAFLTHLEPEYDDVLLHLLECAECRGLARQLLAPRGSLAATVPAERTSGPATLRGPADETLRRLERLLAEPPMLRSRLLGEEEFRDLDLAGLLLERSEAAQPHALRVSEELARLAFAVAEPMVQDRWVARSNDVKARACVLVGNVRRLERDTEAAEEMLSKAVFHLTGPPNCRERAFYCRNVALLREDQGQVDEAAGLLWRAALIYRETGEPREEGSCLAQLGLLFLEEEQIERAVPPLTRACQALQPPADVVPYVRCALALAYCHAALNEIEKSRRFLQAARALYPQLPEGEPRARAAWFEGKVAALTGEPEEEAAERLDEARRAFLAAGKLHVATRISVDLVCVLAGLGREERFESLLSELRVALPVDLEQIGLFFTLTAFIDAAQRKEDLREALPVAISRLRCCRRDPILVLGYWPPELNGTVTLAGSRFDPSLASTTLTLSALHLADQLSGAIDGPDLPKGDAVWK
jgi:tetratricopeptide (TPR) repeat protein